VCASDVLAHSARCALPTPPHLRALRPGDVPALVDALGPVLAAAYPGGDAALVRPLRLALNGAVEAAVIGDGQVIGLALAQLNPQGVKMSCLWVCPDHRRTGVGAALATRVVDAFGARPLSLACDANHAEAMGLMLRSFGFTLDASIPGRYVADVSRSVRSEFAWL
jgi:ribosomal protein S18 acetylase RimI-like enzyme